MPRKYGTQSLKFSSYIRMGALLCGPTEANTCLPYGFPMCGSFHSVTPHLSREEVTKTIYFMCRVIIISEHTLHCASYILTVFLS